jgi:GH15 family glucan-1,4-alpha-glucosidase
VLLVSRPDSTPIEDYALIGDLHTAALVSRAGSVDWLCLPRFDSPACFAALLDDETAGRWLLAPVAPDARPERAYVGETLVLRTRWAAAEGEAEVLDLMPPRGEAADLVRIVRGVRGRLAMRTELAPRFDYGSVAPWVVGRGQEVRAVAGPDALWLRSDVAVEVDDGTLTSEFSVAEGEEVAFVLSHRPAHLAPHEPPRRPAHDALRETCAFWEDWVGRCRYGGRWPAEVRRSLITLKALTYAPTGGIVAAATTSLPEQLGGVRNWDYRYC